MIETVKKIFTPIFRRHSIRKAILFGSFARGDQTSRSDIDLILIQETSQPFLQRYEPILAELNQALQEHAVEVLIYTPQEFLAIQHRPFIRQALEEGILLYEQEEVPYMKRSDGIKLQRRTLPPAEPSMKAEYFIEQIRQFLEQA